MRGVRAGEAAEGAQTSASLQERTYLQLRDMILRGQVRPGERLLEAEVVRAFGISRSPARLALARLCEGGLLEELPGRGYRVAGAAESDGAGLAVLDPVDLSAPRQWERMYEEVEQELFVRTLFGSVRLNELRLAEHFGVSRTVTRDLLARMHGVGLVAKDSAGHWIAEKMTPDRIRHLYELRCLLEPAALRHAAPLVPETALEAMRARILSTRADKPISSARFDEVETDLHITLLSHCPNAEILRALKRTHLLFGPTRYLFDPLLGIPIRLIVAALDEHLAIIELLRDGKAEAAARALETHLQDAVERWLGRFESTTRGQPLAFPSYLRPADPLPA
ncbi:GntR family transcriptional regulator [Xanthobacter sp. KR7-65]|uniref:GntR family transcriptional regulator n=1 Tax=Xanthobacter sp. KR7-65 TaxID=3156612 RepID=UPI0032B4A88F